MRLRQLRENAAHRRSLLLTLVGLEIALISCRAAAQCRIDDPRVELGSATVSASGSTFTLGLRGVPVQVYPDTGTDQARIQVLAPLRFTAQYPAAQLQYRLERPVDLHGGRIRLGAGAVPSWLRVQGNAIEVSLAELLHVDSRQPLRVPCSHIALRDAKAPYATPDPVPPPEGLATGTGEGPVALHAFPIASNPIEVQYPGPYAIQSRRPGWALIEASWADGSRLRGWVRDERLTAAPAPPGGRIEGAARGEELCGRSHAPKLATFTVREGAPIAAAPGGAPWARTTEKLTLEAFPLERSNGWVQIASVPGLASEPCSEHEHLWVHVRDLIWTQSG